MTRPNLPPITKRVPIWDDPKWLERARALVSPTVPTEEAKPEVINVQPAVASSAAVADVDAVMAKEEQAQAEWDSLPWYKKIVPFFLGLIGLVFYGGAEFFGETVFWKVKRWHIATFFAFLAIAFFSGRGVMAFFKNIAIANATPNPTVVATVADPAAVLGVVVTQTTLLENLPVDPAAALVQPIQQSVVDCTVATCPDAQQFIANYQGKTGPEGSATLRASCDKGAKVLGEIPKGTPVWVITSSINQGTYCENGECRRGMIKPIAALLFTHQGGCVSFTALQPVSP